MPEAVKEWVERRAVVGVRQIHNDLLQAFAEDFHKYRGVRSLAPLEASFLHLHHHYGLRFKYESFAPGFRSHQVKTALTRLEGAMLCRQVWPTSDRDPPIKKKARAAPKLLPLDIGLAMTTVGVPFQILQRTNPDELLDGRMAESVVGQLILSTQIRERREMYFWVRQSSRANAEIDFLVETPAGLMPIEVKSGKAGTLKSLHQYLWRSEKTIGIRLWSGQTANERHWLTTPDGKRPYRLISLPLYAAEMLPELEPG